MDIVFYALVVPLVVGLLVCAVMLWRNERVYKFRTLLLDEVSTLTREDIHSGRLDWNSRYVAFDTVSYDDHMWPLKRLKASNYYDNLDFLNGKDVSL